MDAVLQRPLPYRDADRLVAAWDSTPEAGHSRSRVSGFEYLRWREEARTLDALALLGVKAQAGRTLTEDGCEPTAPPVTVISDALWRRKLGADPKSWASP